MKNYRALLGLVHFMNKSIEQRKTGYKPQMWEHKELWEEFKEARRERAQAASLIVSGYAEKKPSAQLAICLARQYIVCSAYPGPTNIGDSDE